MKRNVFFVCTFLVLTSCSSNGNKRFSPTSSLNQTSITSEFSNSKTSSLSEQKISSISSVTSTSINTITSASSSITSKSETTSEQTITKTYTVEWRNWNGSILETDLNVLEGSFPSFDSATPIRESDSRYSYTFSGWSPTLTPVFSNVIYNATFTQVERLYKVEWKNWNGVVLETDYVPFGGVASFDGTTPTREDSEYIYEFTGWNQESGPVYQDTIYIAQFSSELKYEFDNIYHWTSSGIKTCHDYKEGPIYTFTCSICKHSVEEVYSYKRKTIDDVSCYYDLSGYIAGTKDFIVPFHQSITKIVGNDSSPRIPFSNMLDMENLWLPKNIEFCLLSELKVLKQVNIENTCIQTFGADQFQSCNKLKEIMIPSSLTSFGADLKTCSSLETIKAKEGNTTFYSENNCLCRESDHALIQVPHVTDNFKFPDTVTTIGGIGNCFEACYFNVLVIPETIKAINTYAFTKSSIKNVIWPKSVNKIGSATFYESYVSQVVIPKNVTVIEEKAFMSCDVKLLYEGSSDEYSEMGGIIGCNASSLYYYSETSPLSSGKYWHYVDGVPTTW